MSTISPSPSQKALQNLLSLWAVQLHIGWAHLSGLESKIVVLMKKEVKLEESLPEFWVAGVFLSFSLLWFVGSANLGTDESAGSEG